MKPRRRQPAPPGTVPLTGPPPPASSPDVIPWQGNPWRSCPASELEYIGPTPKVAKPASVDFNSVPAETQDATIILGIEPRPPTPDEYRTIVGLCSGLADSCWWITEDFSVGGYNCFGHVVAREAAAAGDKLRSRYPANEVAKHVEGSLDTYDTFFGKYGYTRFPEPATDAVPPSARIAWYSGPHVALRSDYAYKGAVLWESKLGEFQVRILHALRAVEGGEYGDLGWWYRIA